MPDIRIHREHQLGLAEARKIAWEWAEQVEQRFGMACTLLEGETSDTLEFSRSGVKGRLIVAADHFDLDAKLGFLLGAFSHTIESEIQKNLDALLAQHAQPRKPAARGARPAAQKEGKNVAKASPKAPAKAAAKKSARATKPGGK